MSPDEPPREAANVQEPPLPLPPLWSDLLADLTKHFPLVERSPCALRFSASTGEQPLRAAVVLVNGRLCLLLTAEICPIERLSPREALELGAELLLGGMVRDGAVLALRHGMPDGRFRVADVPEIARRLRQNAALLRQRLMADGESPKPAGPVARFDDATLKTLRQGWPALLDAVAQRHPVVRREDRWVSLRWPDSDQSVQVTCRLYGGRTYVLVTADVLPEHSFFEADALELADRMIVCNLIIQAGILVVRSVLAVGYSDAEVDEALFFVRGSANRLRTRLQERHASAGRKLFDLFV